MCGRFTQAQIAELDKEIFKLLHVPPLEPRYNIAPSEDAAVIRERGPRDGRHLDLLRWGLIPHWARDPSIGFRTINARAESVATKPTFRDAFAARRCLVPTDGFYEWRKTGGRKQPYYVRLRSGDLFALAGLWERWEPGDGAPVETFTIITTDANAAVRPLHDRMPAVLPPEAYDRWLDPAYGDVEALRAMLRPYPPEEMTAHPVSPYVSDPRNKGPRCIEPVEA